MPNREYEKGARAERELMAAAIETGANAYRGAGSHGAYDVVITRDGIRFLVNIKCNNWAGPDDRYRLARLASAHDVPVLARRVDRKGWTYRALNAQGDMGQITALAPWSDNSPSMRVWIDK